MIKTWTRPEDKAGMPPGVWQDEPDKVQWIDEATGLDCLANRNRYGVWCGYVGVPHGHPYHGRDVSELPDWEVHGDINFADGCQEGHPPSEGVCHVPERGRPADVWWIGFDCGHLHDYAPAMDYRKQKLGIPRSPFDNDVYRTLGYVQRVVEDLARQIADKVAPSVGEPPRLSHHPGEPGHQPTGRRTNMTLPDDLTYEERTGWELALTDIAKALVHHLNAADDPCQDRGVEWPCDVADAILPDVGEHGFDG